MNFLDAYDITDPTTTPSGSQEGPEPTLNEEVKQVVGQLSRFWGGFRKQVSMVIHTPRRCLSGAIGCYAESKCI